MMSVGIIIWYKGVSGILIQNFADILQEWIIGADCTKPLCPIAQILIKIVKRAEKNGQQFTKTTSMTKK